jgi:hypothetical protein
MGGPFNYQSIASAGLYLLCLDYRVYNAMRMFICKIDLTLLWGGWNENR